MTRAKIEPSLVLALFVAAVVVGPAALGGHLAGSPAAETYGHAWVQWWAGLGWPGWPTGTTLAAGSERWPVIDPLPTWVAAGLGCLLGTTAAWNLVLAAGVVVTSLGGARLCRALGGSPAVGAVGLPLSAIYLGSLQSGLTEDAFLGLVALSWALALEGRWIRAGLLAGITAGFGLYLGWFAGVGLACLGAWTRPGLSGVVSLRAAVRPVAALGLAAGLALAFAAPFRGTIAAPVARPEARAEPLWQLNPWRGADVVSFVVPGRPDKGDTVGREHPAYVGFATVGLALAGGFHPAFLGVAAAVVAAPGDSFSVAGKPTGLANPAAALLHPLPMGDRFRNHARLMLVGQLLLVALASRGARRLAERFPAAVPLGVGLLLAEAAWLSPAALPLHSTEAVPRGIYAALPGDETVVRVVGEQNPQRAFFDQRFHGHPLANNPNRPDPGRPRPGEIVVAFGPAVAPLTTELGTPFASVDGGAAWVVPLE